MDNLTEIETEVAKVIGVSNEVIHPSRPAPTPIIAAPAGVAADAQVPVAAGFALEIAGTLKPEKLSKTDTPQQFHAWEERLQAYFTTGGLDRISIGA